MFVTTDLKKFIKVFYFSVVKIYNLAPTLTKIIKCGTSCKVAPAWETNDWIDKTENKCK